MQNNSIATPKNTKANCKPTTKPSKTDVFIEKARAKHGEAYDYSKAVYIRSKDKVIITCREHGDFEQAPESHLRGRGCAKCDLSARRSSTEEWVLEAVKAHGDRYSYSKVKYARSKDKVVITCSTHGDFEQTPESHLRGQGCAKCAGMHSYSTEEWIVEARSIHGDRYFYGKTVYARSKKNVIITCRDHGDFEQTPESHLRGRGCAKCSGKHHHSTAEWVSKARSMHGEAYDYSKAVYIRSKDKVIITCKEHGDFEQKAASHLRGQGCAKCSGRHIYSTEEWVLEAIKVHGDRYDYGEVVYLRAKDKVVIACKEHGRFEQTPNGHLGGQGCPRCPRRYDDPASLYVMANNYDQVKIGYSIEPEARLSKLNRDAPFSAELLKTWVLPDTPAARAAEAAIHQELAGYHAGLSGFDGATEWFNTTFEYALGVIERIVLEGESGDLEDYSEPVRDSTKMQQIALW